MARSHAHQSLVRRYSTVHGRGLARQSEVHSTMHLKYQTGMKDLTSPSAKGLPAGRLDMVRRLAANSIGTSLNEVLACMSKIVTLAVLDMLCHLTTFCSNLTEGAAVESYKHP